MKSSASGKNLFRFNACVKGAGVVNGAGSTSMAPVSPSLDPHDSSDNSWSDSSERSCWVKGHQEQLPSRTKGAGGTGHQ